MIRKNQSGQLGAETEKSLLHTRHSLLKRLADWEDRDGWEQFYAAYWRVIHAFAMRSGLSEPEAFDVVQETVVDVAQQVRQGKYDPKAGKFRSWLFRLVRWRVTDIFRERGRFSAMERKISPLREEDPNRTATVEQIPDNAAGAAWEQDWDHAALATAVERVRGKVNPKHFQIFECSVLRGWNAARVSRELGVNAAQVYLARHRVGALVRKEVDALERPQF